jgi:hypothetical protein
MTNVQEYELLKTVSGLFDGTLERSSADALTHRLAQDTAAQAFYLEAVALEFELEWLCNGDLSKKILRSPTASTLTAVDDTSSTNLAQSSFSLPSRSTLSVRSKPRFLIRPALRYAALVALCLYGSFALIAWNLRPDKLRRGTDDDKASVAVVRNTTDVQWPKDSRLTAARGTRLTGRHGHQDPAIHPGEPLSIASGTMELELNTGTTLVVVGPADWSVDGQNRVSLRAGKLLARVPQQAIGFTVETPTAKIVDLGTEFDVEVSESGTTEVQVSKGKVELHPGRPTSAASMPLPITLSAGTARRVEVGSTGESTVSEIAHEPRRFLPHTKPIGAARLPVQGAMASSELRESDRRANHLINGSGLRGDRHTRMPNGTMWQSAYGKVKGEYVFFDLGRQCRLDSMKIWNYNEHDAANERYRYHGVGRASIYVSDTSKGTPLEPDGDWRLVAADLKFSPADGSDHYASPNVFPLDSVTARFVAIVVDSQLAIDPIYTTPQSQSVGLSEVQFFGSRVTRATR